jgi:hypothetical protein
MKKRVLTIIYFICSYVGIIAAPKYYILDAPSYNPGFFSCFHSVVGFLEFYENHKDECAGIKVNFTTGRYLDPRIGPNWWNYFFEPIEIGYVNGADIEHITDQQKRTWALDAILMCNREAASRVIAKYVRVKPHIQKKVSAFVNKYFTKENIIGVHFRGTDKKNSFNKLTYDAAYEVLMRTIKEKKLKQYVIFIASDEQAFIDYMVKRCPNVVFCDAYRTKNGHAIHKEKQHDYSVGEEGLVDCLLLAHCSVILRTYSNLNSAASNINPTVSLITMNQEANDFYR